MISEPRISPLLVKTSPSLLFPVQGVGGGSGGSKAAFKALFGDMSKAAQEKSKPKKRTIQGTREDFVEGS